jgi:hypothetical protein
MIWDVHPGSDFFSYPGSRGKKSTGSRIRILNTGFLIQVLQIQVLYAHPDQNTIAKA